MCTEGHKDIIEKLDRLEGKVDKLNGSVAANTRWRFIMAGGLTVMTIVVLPLMGIIITLVV